MIEKIVRKLPRGKRSRLTNRMMKQMMSRNPTYSHFDIGAWSYGYPEVFLWGEDATLKIGKFCSIAEGVKILLGGEHRTDWLTTYPLSILFDQADRYPGHPHSKGDVIIGNDVWIAMDAMILSGAEIGDGAVISARSLVTQDVPAYAVVGGNPAKVIRFRFDEKTRNALRTIAWWNWPEEKIKDALPLLLSSDVDRFIDHCTANK